VQLEQEYALIIRTHLLALELVHRICHLMRRAPLICVESEHRLCACSAYSTSAAHKRAAAVASAAAAAAGRSHRHTAGSYSTPKTEFPAAGIKSHFFPSPEYSVLGYGFGVRDSAASPSEGLPRCPHQAPAPAAKLLMLLDSDPRHSRLV
jgi:hypothetical protein